MAITRIQFKSASGASVSSLVITPNTAPSTGNLQVVTIAYNSATTNKVTSITQTNATWVRAVQKNNSLGGAISTDIWYAESTSSPGATITINLGSSLDIAATYLEYSGIASSSSLDKTATNEDSIIGGE
jgi:hypothetical protein